MRSFSSFHARGDRLGDSAAASNVKTPASSSPSSTIPSRAEPTTRPIAPPRGQAPQQPAHGRLGSVATDREIFLRGKRAFARGDDAGALDNLTRLISHGFEYADVYYMLGMVHERRGEIDTAVHSLRRAIRINPSYVEALLALASLHEQRGDFDQSQGYAERASQLSRPSAGGLDPTTRGKLANQQAALGDALAQSGERPDAILEYRRALDRCPTFHDVRHRLGVTLREAGLPSQAALEFQQILRAHPRMLDSQVQLGLTYYSMGRTPKAITEWEAVLEKDLSRDDARMYLRLVRNVQNRAAGSAIKKPAVTVEAARDNDSNGKHGSSDETEISAWATSLLTSPPGDPTP
ncbi:MAG TPA: tetratricopeptide repeat protein [Myxococcales bacterium]|nr:tetratricopeptide repeat protein [Myxococcales bacterium]HIK85603.1 tetratricopeptide repeat protein [Myxococcales bacterium]